MKRDCHVASECIVFNLGQHFPVMLYLRQSLGLLLVDCNRNWHTECSQARKQQVWGLTAQRERGAAHRVGSLRTSLSCDSNCPVSCKVLNLQLVWVVNMQLGGARQEFHMVFSWHGACLWPTKAKETISSMLDLVYIILNAWNCCNMISDGPDGWQQTNIFSFDWTFCVIRDSRLVCAEQDQES